MLAKELKNMECELPDPFVADGIIAKMPPTWLGFATSLKHRRQEFSVTDLIATLGVEENAMAKDTRAKKVHMRGFLALTWCKRIILMQPTRKRKSRMLSSPKLRASRRRTKKRLFALFVVLLITRQRSALTTRTNQTRKST
jgi:hypothetical protein